MIVPPDMLSARLDFTTSGVTLTNTIHTLIAAPGAGLRIRLWVTGASLRPQQAAGTNVRYIYGALAPAASYVELVLTADSRKSDENVLPGGMALPENSGVRCVSASAQLSVAFTAWALYTIERV